MARIDGAVSMADMKIDMKIDDGNFKVLLPSKPDPKYKHAILTDEVCESKDNMVMMVSEDGKNFTLAVCVEINGQEYTAEDIGQMLRPYSE